VVTEVVRGEVEGGWRWKRWERVVEGQERQHIGSIRKADAARRRLAI
jgi:hypothetical protein